MWIYRNASLIRCEKAWQMRLQIETPTWGLDAINKDAERNLNRHPWPLVTFLCKSLVFGFVDADSFRYFDSIYNLQIKFIYKYLRPMVIHCKRLNQIPSILWGDIRDLSQILHYPGNDSIMTSTPPDHSCIQAQSVLDQADHSIKYTDAKRIGRSWNLAEEMGNT